MVLTCYTCPRQLCFEGTDREKIARVFGWTTKGTRFFCIACAARRAALVPITATVECA